MGRQSQSPEVPTSCEMREAVARVPFTSTSSSRYFLRSARRNSGFSMSISMGSSTVPATSPTMVACAARLAAVILNTRSDVFEILMHRVPASSKYWGNPARRYRLRALFRGHGIRVSSVLTFRSASERAALRQPRVVKTHSGAPEPQVSRPPDGLSPRARRFRTTRAPATRPPNPFRRCWFPTDEKRILRGRREEARTRVARRASSPRPHGRTHVCVRRYTTTRVPRPARADPRPPPPRFRPKQRLPKTSLAESPFRSSRIE